MIQPPDERLPPMTPQLALRVAIAGSVALALFAVIFFRLWFLQVLSSTQYAKAAEVNFVRDVDVPAQRGAILDSSGTQLVYSYPTNAVMLIPGALPVPITQLNLVHQPRADMRLYARLAAILQLSTHRTRCPFDLYANNTVIKLHPRLAAIPCSVAQQVAQVPYADVKIDTDVDDYVHDYLAERETQFKGVEVQKAYERQYPFGDVAAQLFGTIGPINSSEYGTSGYKGVPEQAIVGQSGLEYQYDQYLRGADGKQEIRVNADNQFEGYGKTIAPTTGDNLKLSLNVQVQKVGQAALEHSIEVNDTGAGGAFVALNPDNGQVYAMGSEPSFDPSVFAEPFLPQSVYDQLTSPSSDYPLLNRAIQTAGPTGSTFKVITATAALESGDWSVDQTFDDTGQFCLDGECRHNSGHAVDGVLNLVDALRVSSDDFFYNLGARTNVDVPAGGPLQVWAKKFGIGQATGIDLPGEASGTLPTPAWRAHENALEAQCDNLTHPTAEFPNHPYHKLPGGGCGLVVYPFEPWTVGDNENTAVGQGDDQVTPMQLAVAYSALANGGTVVTPHLGEDIQTPNGTVVQNIDPAPKGNLHINPTYLDTILTGLREAASQPGGTSDDVMGNFPEQVYGKTGTAQHFLPDGTEEDYAWYACFVPASATTKPIVVVVTVEKGGFGDVAAAPVARQILSQWFLSKPGPYVAGTSLTL
jgi:penicillin-binding protein 2